MQTATSHVLQAGLSSALLQDAPRKKHDGGVYGIRGYLVGVLIRESDYLGVYIRGPLSCTPLLPQILLNPTP